MKALASLLENACRNGCRIKDALGEHTGSEIERLRLSIEKDLTARNASSLEPVIISIANTAADIAAFYAAWRKGMVAVPLHESAPHEVVTQMKNTVGARLVIRGGKVEGADEKLSHDTMPEDAALIIFTSGSTGRPKGVMLGHDRLAAKIEILDQLLKFNSADKIAVPLQLTFVFGTWVSLLAMKAGATLLLKSKFSVSEMNTDLRSGVSIIAVVPTMLRSMELDIPVEGNNLRQILTGGEPFIAALAEKVRAAFPATAIFDLYGSTETGSCDFYLNVARPSGQGTIGTPTAGVSFRIVSESEHDCELDEIGELRILSPFGMLGYFGDQAATDSAFDNRHYFRTGDLARKQANGLVQLAGRKKEIISRGGIKISPLEVDAVFSKHPDVAAALCGGIPDDRLGETLHMLIVRRNGAELEAHELMTWAATKIEKVKLPNTIHFVETLPLGRTGKADRAAVKKMVFG